MKKTALFLSALMLVGSFAACGEGSAGMAATPASLGSSQAARTGANQTEAPGSGNGDRELRMTMISGNDIATLDPLKSVGPTEELVIASLYDLPWVYDLDFNVHFRAATGCHISEDGLTYTIPIRQGIQFTNGEMLTAEDFAYSCEVVKLRSTSYIWAKHFETVEVLDDTTVQITLTQPYAPMMMLMADDLYILPKAAHEAAGQDFGFSPIGSGPYKLERHVAGDSITLVANEDYYLMPAAIKRVSYKLIPESTSVSTALKTGEIDFSSDFARADLAELAAHDSLQLIDSKTRSFRYATYNMTIEPFNNPLFRQAINYAVNREAMIQIAGEGHGTIGNGIVNELVFGYSETEGWDYNPEKARALLAEAGYPNGEDVPEHTLYYYSGVGAKLPQVFQQNLKDIGIRWPVEEVDANLLWEYQESGVAAISFDGILLGRDAAAYAAMLATGGGFNRAFYSHPVVDTLFALGASASDPEKRKTHYERIWDCFQKDAPYMVLYYNTALILCSADLDLSQINLFGLYGATSILPYYLSWE